MSEENALEKIGKGSVVVFLGVSAGTFFQYLYKMFLARSLAPDSFGVFVQGLGTMQSVATVSLLGIPIATSRFISYYAGKKKRQEQDQVTSTGLVMVVVVSTAVAAIMYMLSELIAVQIFGDAQLIVPMKIFSAVLPFFAITSFILSLFRAREDAIQKAIISDFLWSGLIVLFVLTSLKLGYQITGAATSYLAATAITAAVAALIYSKKYRTGFEFSKPMIRKILLFSWPLVIVTMLGVLNRWFDVLMMGWLKTSSMAGTYEIAFSLSGYVALLLQIIGFMFLPVVAKLHAQSRKDKIREVYTAAARWMTMLSLPALVGMVILPEAVIDLLFGSQYTSGSTALSILATGFFYKVSKGPAGMTLVSMNENRKLLVGKVMMAFLIVSLNLLLIPRYGLVGAAVSTLIAYIISDSVLLFFAQEKLGGRLHSKKILRILLAGSVASLMLLAAKKYFAPSTLESVALGVFFVIVYAALLIQMKGVDREDMKTLREMIKKDV